MNDSEQSHCGYSHSNLDHRGLWINTNNTIIENNTITNNYYGIILENAHHNIIRNNNATNNAFSFYLQGSSYNTFSGNTLTNNAFSFYLQGSSYNTFSGNNATNNFLAGFVLGGSYNNLTGNTATNNNQEGFTLDGSYNNLTGNTATNNYRGFYLYGSNNNLTGNTATNSFASFILDGSNNNLTGNTAIYLWGNYGFYMTPNSYNNTLTGNINIIFFSPPQISLFYLFCYVQQGRQQAVSNALAVDILIAPVAAGVAVAFYKKRSNLLGEKRGVYGPEGVNILVKIFTPLAALGIISIILLVNLVIPGQYEGISNELWRILSSIISSRPSALVLGASEFPWYVFTSYPFIFQDILEIDQTIMIGVHCYFFSIVHSCWYWLVLYEEMGTLPRFDKWITIHNIWRFTHIYEFYNWYISYDIRNSGSCVPDAWRKIRVQIG